MAETATVAAATSSNTIAPAQTSQPGPAPAAAPESPRPGSIPDAQFDRPSPEERDRYARVKKAGENGGAEWVHRDQLSKDPPGSNTSAIASTLVPDQKYQFGDLELSGQQIMDLQRFKGEHDMRRAAVPAATKFASQGAASFSQAHREPNTTGPGRVSEEEYNSMSQAERFAYAKSFDQRQFQNRSDENGEGSEAKAISFDLTALADTSLRGRPRTSAPPPQPPPLPRSGRLPRAAGAPKASSVARSARPAP
jgi:hypothetical protein